MANPKNNGTVFGRLARDLTIKTNEKDGSRTVLGTIAADADYTLADGTRPTNFVQFEDFIRADRTGNGIYDTLSRGMQLILTYEVRSDSWTDKNGQPQYRQYLKVDRINYAEPKSASDARLHERLAKAEAAAAQAGQPVAAQAAQPELAGVGAGDENLPFA